MASNSQTKTNRGSLSSTSSTSSESSAEFIPYSQRKEWDDIEPLAQDDGPNPVVTIAYTDVFRETFDYFRAVLTKNELSLRALELTADCVSFNPSNYTIWFFRRLVINQLKVDLFSELKYIESVIIENAKNYQVWHHRKCVVEKIKEQILDKDSRAEGDINEKRNQLNEVLKEEKVFIAFMLRQDSKNYHGWQHRQWLIKEFESFDEELEYTEELIEDDIRNNSAWNHRHYVISNTTGFVGPVLGSEIQFTCHKIKLAPNNESAWNYLRGIVSEVGLNSDESVQQMCEDLYRNIETHRSPHLLSFMVDLIAETLAKQMEVNHKVDNSLFNRAIQLCEDLSNKIDPIRKEYWNYIARGLKDSYEIKVNND